MKYVHVDRRAEAGIVGGGQIDGVLPPVALHTPYSVFVKMFLVKNILFIRRYSLTRLQYIDLRVELFAKFLV